VDASNFDIVKAVQYGAVDRVIELIEGGYDPNQRDHENVTLLHWSAINNRKEVVQYLLSKGSEIDAIGGDLQSTPMHWATRQGHLSMVVLLLNSGADASILDGEGCNCLHLAAQFGHTAIAAFLIAKGEEINATDASGMTALMWSAYRISTNDPTRLLITLGASLNLSDHKHKNTALHWAVYSRNSNAVSLLLKAGADTTITNGVGDTPLDMAKKLQISWLMPRLCEVVQEKEDSKSSSMWSRLKNDKQIRYWSMMSAPFLVYFWLGYTFHSDMTYLSKLISLLLLLLAVILASRYIFDDRLHHILPISIYLATKIWLYITFFVFLMPGLSASHVNMAVVNANI
jgi:palmitoyltransferase